MKNKIAFQYLRSILVSPVACLILLTACQGSKRDMLLGTWTGVKIINQGLDSFYKDSQNYIDTFGKNHTPKENYAMYGVTDIDSLRKEMQKQFDESKKVQQEAVLKTTFNFRKDNLVAISFHGSLDTSSWTLDSLNIIHMTDLIGPNKGSNIEIEILKLTDKELTLRFHEQEEVSTVVFNKGKSN